MSLLHYPTLFAPSPWSFWSGTTFAFHPTSEVPPIFGLTFHNAEAGRAIFRQWTSVRGHNDELEELRVSVIEGDAPGHRPGYAVHLCPDPDNVMTRATAMDEVANEAELRSVGIADRMYPPGGKSEMLEQFKAEYAKHGMYLLAPALLGEDGQLWWDTQAGIEKTVIHFRNMADVQRNADDLDARVLDLQDPYQILKDLGLVEQAGN